LKNFTQIGRTLVAAAAFGMIVLAAASCGARQDRSIVVASTTSTQDSGLFDYLLPIVKERTGITVKVIAQGTGQALDTGRRGDADVVFVHARQAELKFLAEGESLKRYPVMYNDFVLIGPKSDPAGIKGMKDVGTALQAIKNMRASFISRGDRSGTHIAELGLWKDSGIDIDKDQGPWYKSIGQGMGAALTIASASDAYTLSDRGTWIQFKNKGDLQIVVEGDRHLFNQYGVMLVNPDKHPNVKRELGQQFIDYLISPRGQNDIAQYTIDGEQLFHPNANEGGADVPALRLHAAGSLRAAMTDIANTYSGIYGTEVNAVFGASGALRDRLANGEPGDVFASADLGNPQALTQAGKAGPTVLFARNHLCAIVRPGLDVTPATILATMLNPSVKVATSTPKNDPGGDYAWAMFQRADAERPGSRATLEAKALKIGNVPGSLPVPPGVTNATVWLFREKRADIFLSYCTNADAVAAELPAVTTVHLPPALAVTAGYGLTVLKEASRDSARFALFVLSPAGQRILEKHGFDAPLLP
jgi:tungstate transport system substrate-binding protein